MLKTLIIQILTALEGTPLEELMGGDWFGAVMGVYAPIGYFVYVILFLLGPAMIAIKMQSFIPASFAIMGTGAAIAALLPAPILFFIAVLAIMGLAAILWMVSHG